FVSNCTASSSFDPGNGRTRLTYQVRRTGTFTVSVLTAAGELVSRGMVQVLPGPVDISSIQASWDDTQLPVAGRPLTLEVALRDQFSNPLTSSSASSLVALLLPTSAPLPSRSRRHLAQQTLPPLPLPAQPTAAGQRYGQQQPGAMLLGATPMLLHASYAVGEATRAAAATPGVKQQAGHVSEEQAEGELQWVSGGEQAAGQAAQPDSCAPSRRRVLQLSPSATPVTVLGSQAGFNQSTGIASVTFNATAAGTYAVAVFVAGVRLTTGLASLVVASGPLDVPACELSGSATVVNCGEVFNLLVLARDAFDNDLGASPLASRVTNVAGILTTVAWSYTVDNSPLVAANISIRINEPGTYLLTPVLDNEPMSRSWSVRVLAAPTSQPSPANPFTTSGPLQPAARLPPIPPAPLPTSFTPPATTTLLQHPTPPPPGTLTSGSGSSSRSRMLLVAIGALGVVLVVAVLAGLVLVRKLRRAKEHIQEMHSLDAPMAELPAAGGSHPNVWISSSHMSADERVGGGWAAPGTSAMPAALVAAELTALTPPPPPPQTWTG
ncbi:hypothetical protein QJQ45_024042, partial [Haematococcus lacustris]